MERFHTEHEFLSYIGGDLGGIRAINVRDATRTVLSILNRHVAPEQVEKVKRALPAAIRELWPTPGEAI